MSMDRAFELSGFWTRRISDCDRRSCRCCDQELQERRSEARGHCLLGSSGGGVWSRTSDRDWANEWQVECDLLAREAWPGTERESRQSYLRTRQVSTRRARRE